MHLWQIVKKSDFMVYLQFPKLNLYTKESKTFHQSITT